MTLTSTPRASALPDGGATFRLTPAQVQELIGTLITELNDDDLDVLRELAAEREIPGDLTVDIGRAAVDGLWEQTLADTGNTPGLLEVRVQFSGAQVAEIKRIDSTRRLSGGAL